MRSSGDNQRRRKRVVIALVAVMGVWAGSAFVEADEQQEAAARGKVTFRVYCSNCHGDGAKGDGELAKLLTVAPADLTLISRRYEGEFPAEWLKKKIDGRDPVRGHGMAEMPVWGLSFRHPDNPGDQEAEVGARIDQLVEYLRTIQAKQ